MTYNIPRGKVRKFVAGELEVSPDNSITTHGLKVDAQGNVGIGTRTPSKKLDIDGGVALKGDLDVTGDMSLDGNTTQTGNLTITGNLTQTGAVTIVGDIVQTGDTTRAGDASITGDVTQTGNLTISGKIGVNTSSTANTAIGIGPNLGLIDNASTSRISIGGATNAYVGFGVDYYNRGWIGSTGGDYVEIGTVNNGYVYDNTVLVRDGKVGINGGVFPSTTLSVGESSLGLTDSSSVKRITLAAGAGGSAYVGFGEDSNERGWIGWTASSQAISIGHINDNGTFEILVKDSDVIIGDKTATARTWTAVAFENNWGNYGSGHSTVKYRKDGLGNVQLRGAAVANGSVTTAVFVLPTAYRPAFKASVAGWWYDHSLSKRMAGVIHIHTNGYVYIQNESNTTPTTNDQVYFDGVIFTLDS